MCVCVARACVDERKAGNAAMAAAAAVAMVYGCVRVFVCNSYTLYARTHTRVYNVMY